MVLLLLALYWSTSPAQDRLHLAHNMPVSHPLHIATVKFATDVLRETEGRIKIRVYPNSQLASLRAGAESVQLGTVDIAWVDSGTLGNWIPALQFTSLPYLFEDYDHAIRVSTKLRKELNSLIEKRLGLHLLAWSPAGFRVIISNRPISTTADLKGLKLRVPEVPIYVSFFKSLGVNATTIPWGDIYIALQTGAVDGIEGPPSAILTTGFHEITKFISKTNHIMTDINLLVNLKKWKTLTEQQRLLIQQSAHKYCEVILWNLIQEEEDKSYAELEGILIPTKQIDLKFIEQASQKTWDDYVANGGRKDWIETAIAMRIHEKNN